MNKLSKNFIQALKKGVQKDDESIDPTTKEAFNNTIDLAQKLRANSKKGIIRREKVIRKYKNESFFVKHKYGSIVSREEIIAKMAEDADTTKVAAKAALNSFITCVTKTLKKGGKISLVGFGTFSVSKREARVGRNPQTGKSINIPARKIARFKAGKSISQCLS